MFVVSSSTDSQPSKIAFSKGLLLSRNSAHVPPLPKLVPGDDILVLVKIIADLVLLEGCTERRRNRSGDTVALMTVIEYMKKH